RRAVRAPLRPSRLRRPPSAPAPPTTFRARRRAGWRDHRRSGREPAYAPLARSRGFRFHELPTSLTLPEIVPEPCARTRGDVLAKPLVALISSETARLLASIAVLAAHGVLVIHGQALRAIGVQSVVEGLETHAQQCRRPRLVSAAFLQRSEDHPAFHVGKIAAHRYAQRLDALHLHRRLRRTLSLSLVGGQLLRGNGWGLPAVGGARVAGLRCVAHW